MLVIYDRMPSYVSLKILSIADGKPIKSFKHSLQPNKRVVFMEHFNEKLLVKQEGENIQILDIWHCSGVIYYFFSPLKEPLVNSCEPNN